MASVLGSLHRGFPW